MTPRIKYKFDSIFDPHTVWRNDDDSQRIELSLLSYPNLEIRKSFRLADGRWLGGSSVYLDPEQVAAIASAIVGYEIEP